MPVREAQYIMVITSRTGWTEDFVRWKLPLWRGWAYYHSARLLDGEKMRIPGAVTEEESWISQASERLAALTRASRTQQG